jgi:Ca2+-binding RTX toxin-like protein
MSTNRSMNGGKGADLLSALFVQTHSSVNGGDGNDGITIFALYGGSTASGGAGNDLIGVTTSDANTTIFGGDGNDGITMGTNGSAFGDAGDDIIFGGTGNNSISGGTGDDQITGGVGVDTLSGGTGANTFIFATPGAVTPVAATDVITDWRSGDGNKIDYANALNKLTNTAAAGGISINGAGILGGATTLAAASAYYATVDTANSTAIWNSGSSAFLFVSNAAPTGFDIIQLNNLNSLGRQERRSEEK